MLRGNALQWAMLIVFGFAPVTLADQPKRTSPLAQASPPTQASAPAITGQGPYGGNVHLVSGCRCEVVYSSRQLWVYVSDIVGKPLPARELRGRVSFKDESGVRTFRYDLYPETRNGNALYVPIDRRLSEESARSVEIVLYGLPTETRQPVRFAANLARLLKAERLAIKKQGVCPVTGRPLLVVGNPIRVRLPNRDVFVCCKGCISKLQRSPERYLDKSARKQRADGTSTR